MQAVIALCHFCENHGPRVVVTCQPMRSLPMTFTPSSMDPNEQIVTSSSVDLENKKRPRKESQSQAGCEETSGDLPIYYGDCTRAVYDTEERCNACTSYGTGPCLLSNDHENRTTYISSQVALKELVCERVKNACLRSLSCELTSPSNESNRTASTTPMRIGVASSSFADPDNMMDMENVKKNDGYLMFGDSETGYCLSYAFRLQDAKARGFLRLFSLLIMTQDMSSMATNLDFFLNALKIMKERLQTQSSAMYQLEMTQLDSAIRPEHASMAGRMPHSFFKRKMTIDTNRNLQTVTGNDNIWCVLHRQMMWTLRTQTLRYEDQVMEGVPTQDMLVMMEMEHSDIVEMDLDHPNQAEVTLQQLKNLKTIATSIAEKSEKDLEMVIRHIITGRQLIVESSDQMSSKQFILAMSNLLPIGCLRINIYADQYYYTHQYNMIGCSSLTGQQLCIPASEEVLLIRVVCDGDVGVSLANCQFEIVRRPLNQGEQQGTPMLLQRYKQLLLDSEVHHHVLEATLRSTREQWMSRAKLLYQLEEQRLRDPRMAAADLIRLVRGCTEQDRPVLVFWQEGLSKAYKNHVIATIDELRVLQQ